MFGQTIYWVDAPLGGRLAVVSRPRSALHISALKTAGVDTLVSLLEHGEAASVGLAEEADWCADSGVSFRNVPIADHGVPSDFPTIESAMPGLAAELEAGRSIAAHCYAGLGRSPLFVASVLIHHGWQHTEAIDAVSTARGCAVPEMEAQHSWLRKFALRRRPSGDAHAAAFI
jgi:protein-tyrosine phosphatase